MELDSDVWTTDPKPTVLYQIGARLDVSKNKLVKFIANFTGKVYIFSAGRLLVFSPDQLLDGDCSVNFDGKRGSVPRKSGYGNEFPEVDPRSSKFICVEDIAVGGEDALGLSSHERGNFVERSRRLSDAGENC